LARWSRLKDKERQPAPTPAEPAAPPTPTHADPQAPAQQTGDAPPAAIDLASLPPLDSIGAGSDIRAFLQSGVPAELTKAALRRAWTSDPAIRDFIGIAENQWDFTDPAAIPGFGPIEANTDLAALVRQALGEIAPSAQDHAGASPSVAAAAEPSAQPYGIPDRNADTGRADGVVEVQHSARCAAAQHADASAVAAPAPSRRSHGGALPK
jgi:hypothetical protein